MPIIVKYYDYNFKIIRDEFRTLNQITKVPYYNKIHVISMGNNTEQSRRNGIINYEHIRLPTDLKYFNCSYSKIHKLPKKLPKKLEKLYCESNPIYNLPILPDRLTIFNCCYTEIDQILKLPKSLKSLLCKGCKNLKTLSELPDSLIQLIAKDSGLTKIPKLPPNIEHIDLRNTKVDNMPLLLPSSILSIHLNHTKIFELPLNINMKECLDKNVQLNDKPTINYIYTPIDKFIESIFTAERDSKFETTQKYLTWRNNMYTKFANKIGDWFLECKYNPKYKYCKDRLNKEFNESFSKSVGF